MNVAPACESLRPQHTGAKSKHMSLFVDVLPKEQWISLLPNKSEFGRCLLGTFLVHRLQAYGPGRLTNSTCPKDGI